MAAVALSAASFLGRSCKVSLFAALVAAAGLVNEFQSRREDSGSKQATEG
jgi:hypothetical protein